MIFATTLLPVACNLIKVIVSISCSFKEGTTTYDMTFFRTYAGTLYIAYCQHEILHTIISFFQIDITFNVSLELIHKVNLKLASRLTMSWINEP